MITLTFLFALCSFKMPSKNYKNCFEIKWIITKLKKHIFSCLIHNINLKSNWRSIQDTNNKKSNSFSIIFLGPKRVLRWLSQLSPFLEENTYTYRVMWRRVNKASVLKALPTTTKKWPNCCSIKYFLELILCSRYELYQLTKNEIRFSIKFRS